MGRRPWGERFRRLLPEGAPEGGFGGEGGGKGRGGMMLSSHFASYLRPTLFPCLQTNPLNENRSPRWGWWSMGASSLRRGHANLPCIVPICGRSSSCCQKLQEEGYHRSHFGSRYNMGCCGFASLFWLSWSFLAVRAQADQGCRARVARTEDGGRL